MTTRPGAAPGGPFLRLSSVRPENAADSCDPVSVSARVIQSTLAFMNDAPAAFGMWTNTKWRPRPAAGRGRRVAPAVPVLDVVAQPLELRRTFLDVLHVELLPAGRATVKSCFNVRVTRVRCRYAARAFSNASCLPRRCRPCSLA